MFINGVIAVVFAYLLGSIPSSHIVARMQTGKNIRRLSGGSAGTLAVFREVGPGSAAFVVILNASKGAAAVLGVPSILNVPPLFLLAAGLAATAGHIWPVFLKFRGEATAWPPHWASWLSW